MAIDETQSQRIPSVNKCSTVCLGYWATAVAPRMYVPSLCRRVGDGTLDSLVLQSTRETRNSITYCSGLERREVESRIQDNFEGFDSEVSSLPRDRGRQSCRLQGRS